MDRRPQEAARPCNALEAIAFALPSILSWLSDYGELSNAKSSCRALRAAFRSVSLNVRHTRGSPRPLLRLLSLSKGRHSMEVYRVSTLGVPWASLVRAGASAGVVRFSFVGCRLQHTSFEEDGQGGSLFRGTSAFAIDSALLLDGFFMNVPANASLHTLALTGLDTSVSRLAQVLRSVLTLKTLRFLFLGGICIDPRPPSDGTFLATDSGALASALATVERNTPVLVELTFWPAHLKAALDAVKDRACIESIDLEYANVEEIKGMAKALPWRAALRPVLHAHSQGGKKDTVLHREGQRVASTRPPARSFEKVDFLVRHSDVALERNKAGSTAFLEAVKSGLTSCLRFLPSCEELRQRAFWCRNYADEPPLYLAALMGNAELVKRLCNELVHIGIDVVAVRVEGSMERLRQLNSSRRLGIRETEWRGEKILLLAGVDVVEKLPLFEEGGFTLPWPRAAPVAPPGLRGTESAALLAGVARGDWVCQALRQAAVEVLRDAAGRLSCDSRGFTSLHAATIGRSVACMEALLTCPFFCASPRADFGVTPLHCAARHVDGAAVDLLLKRGADASLRDSSGTLPIDMARAAMSQQAFELLGGTGAVTAGGPSPSTSYRRRGGGGRRGRRGRRGRSGRVGRQ